MPKNEDLYMTDALRRWREKTDVPFLIVAIASIPFLLLELVSHRLAGSDKVLDRKSTRLNSSHVSESRMPSSA